MESEFEEDDPHFAFGDEFEEEMDKFWLDEKPVRQDEIDNLFEEEEDFEEGDGEEWGVEGLENLDASEQEAVDQVMNEEEDEALLAEEVALLQALQEEKGPEKLLLDSTNVDKLINMLSRVRLAWPENLPGYDATEYATDPERAKFPSTFYQNTDKEKTVLWHAENFRRQFQAQFPRRRALVIAPKNECGTQKLFPTFINPCVLGYPEFLDALTCAEFFKEFFAPELMEHPTRVPSRIRSHVTVLKNRKANCYEYAVILATFLIGAGYDAYVVDGYASKAACTMDATEDYVEPPDVPIGGEEKKGVSVLMAPKPKQPDPSESKMDILSGIFGRRDEEEEVVVKSVSPTKYRFKRAVEVASQVGELDGGGADQSSEVEESSLQEYSDMEMEDNAQLGIAGDGGTNKVTNVGDTSEEEEGEENETMFGRRKRKRPSCPEKYYATRTHSWVLVKAGRRDVPAPFFIEPFSATAMSLDDETFFGVETIFNHKNFWVSLEDPLELYAGEISYDLSDTSKWAKLLVEVEKKKKLPEEEKSLFQDEEDDVSKKAELLLDMPVSFTPDPDIPQEDYERKYPGGKKTFNYNNAIVELAAPYVMDDGLVRKVLKFKGTGRDPSDLEYIEEKFENRKDKLAKRKWFREGRLLHEYFHRGRKDALKEHVHVSGKNKANYPRDLYYYANAHTQGVAHRQILRKGMVEKFEGRDDLLYYRFTSYGGILCNSITAKRSSVEEDEVGSKSKAREFLEMLKGNNSGAKKRVRRKMSKIVEKYHRDETKEVCDDVAEKHMLIDEGRLRILFHYGEGNLTRHSLEFFKPKGSNPDTADFHPEDCIEYLPDPHSPPTDVYRKFKLLQRMEADQRVASVLAAQAEEEVFETVASRVQEDFLHEIEPDAFAGERNEEYMKMKEQKVADDEDEDEEDFTDVDFTSPFFEKFGVPRNKVEEVLMKKRIMLNAKVRLVRRAHAIREMYERETLRLTEKMRWVEKNAGKMNQSEEEDFNRMYKEHLFSLHIMEKRLVRHQELASGSYYKTLLKVLKHPLLNKYSKKKIAPPPPPVPEMSEEEKARLAALAAKLKDCCQFYTIKYTEPKKQNDRHNRNNIRNNQNNANNDAAVGDVVVEAKGDEGQVVPAQ